MAGAGAGAGDGAKKGEKVELMIIKWMKHYSTMGHLPLRKVMFGFWRFKIQHVYLYEPFQM